MFTAVVRLCQNTVASRLKWFEQRLQHLTRPSTISTIVGAVTDLTRSKAELVVENALLRQQLVVLKRSVKRPRLTHTDRRLLVVLASRLTAWQNALILVKPATLINWHQRLFRLVWRHKSRAGIGRPSLAQDLVALIRRMAQDNPLWGRTHSWGVAEAGCSRQQRHHPQIYPTDAAACVLSSNMDDVCS